MRRFEFVNSKLEFILKVVFNSTLQRIQFNKRFNFVNESIL